MFARQMLQRSRRTFLGRFSSTASVSGQSLLLHHLDRNRRIDRRFSSSNRQSSVSADEVSKFSTMDDMWWDPEKHPLVAMNPIRVQYIVDTLRSLRCLNETDGPPLRGLSALDVGCGGGLLSESLARLGATVTALDPSEALVDAARKHARIDPITASIDYRGGLSVEDLAASTEPPQFDVICILEVIEHVSNISSLLRSASSLLKQDGVVFVSTINRTWKSHVLAIVGAEYIMGYIPVGTHDWNQFRSPHEVRELMQLASLEQVSVKGMTMPVPPLDGKWRWRLDARDTDVNWIGAYRRVNRVNSSSD